MRFELIALDADDTLWHNEIYYRRGREIFTRVMAKHDMPIPDDARLHEIELSNLEFYGYGAVGFAVSLVEAAIEMTGGQIPSEDLLTLLNVSKMIIAAEVELFEGVEEALQRLSSSHQLMLITKGNELHQATKVERSGLLPYLNDVEIVANKTPDIYRAILERTGTPPERFIMVGNAMRSDILPVLAIGGSAVYIHNELTWIHENSRAAGLPTDRFFEIDKILDLPDLIYALEG